MKQRLLSHIYIEHDPHICKPVVEDATSCRLDYRELLLSTERYTGLRVLITIVRVFVLFLALL